VFLWQLLKIVLSSRYKEKQETVLIYIAMYFRTKIVGLSVFPMAHSRLCNNRKRNKQTFF